jgi:hypothetical protein
MNMNCPTSHVFQCQNLCEEAQSSGIDAKDGSGSGRDLTTLLACYAGAGGTGSFFFSVPCLRLRLRSRRRRCGGNDFLEERSPLRREVLFRSIYFISLAFLSF